MDVYEPVFSMPFYSPENVLCVRGIMITVASNDIRTIYIYTNNSIVIIFISIAVYILSY